MVASSRCRVQPVPATPAKPLPPPSAYSTAGMRQAVAPPLLSYVQARDGDWHLASVFLDAVSRCGPAPVWVPHKLYPRRLPLGVIGCLLKQPPTARGDVAMTPRMVRELLRSTCQRWPGHTLAWVSAEADVLGRTRKNASTRLIKKSAHRPGMTRLAPAPR